MKWLALEKATQNLTMRISMPDELARQGNSLAPTMGKDLRFHGSELVYREISEKLDSSRTTFGARTSQKQQTFPHKGLSKSSSLDFSGSDSTPKLNLKSRLSVALPAHQNNLLAEQSYCGWVKWFTYFHNARLRAEMGELDQSHVG